MLSSQAAREQGLDEYLPRLPQLIPGQRCIWVFIAPDDLFQDETIGRQSEQRVVYVAFSDRDLEVYTRAFQQTAS